MRFETESFKITGSGVTQTKSKPTQALSRKPVDTGSDSVIIASSTTTSAALSTNTDIPEPRPTNSVEILLTTQTLVESGATTTFTGTIVLTRTIDTSSTPQAKVPQIDSVPTTVAQANTGSKLMARLQLVLLPLLMM